MTMTRASTRPIRRAPAPPSGRAKVLAALLPWKHQLRFRSAEILASVEWRDLYGMTDERRLADEVLDRLARPETARFLVDKFDPHDRVGDPPRLDPPVDPPGDRPGEDCYTALWMPAVGDEGRDSR